MADRQYTRHDLEIDQAVAEAREVVLPPTPNDVVRPQWLMLGVEHGDGTVSVYASDKLTGAQFTAYVGKIERVSEENPTPWREFDPGPTIGYRISSLAERVVEARGRTYAEAIRELFDHWNPGGPELELEE